VRLFKSFDSYNIDSWVEFLDDIKGTKGFADSNGDPISKKEAQSRFKKNQSFFVKVK